jgi:hypothetical protein
LKADDSGLDPGSLLQGMVPDLAVAPGRYTPAVSWLLLGKREGTKLLLWGDTVLTFASAQSTRSIPSPDYPGSASIKFFLAVFGGMAAILEGLSVEMQGGQRSH